LSTSAKRAEIARRVVPTYSRMAEPLAPPLDLAPVVDDAIPREEVRYFAPLGFFVIGHSSPAGESVQHMPQQNPHQDSWGSTSRSSRVNRSIAATASTTGLG